MLTARPPTTKCNHIKKIANKQIEKPINKYDFHNINFELSEDFIKEKILYANDNIMGKFLKERSGHLI